MRSSDEEDEDWLPIVLILIFSAAILAAVLHDYAIRVDEVIPSGSLR